MTDDKQGQKGDYAPMIKYNKDEVGYVMPSPQFNEGIMCASCRFYKGENTCHLVTGITESIGYCNQHKDKPEMVASIQDAYSEMEQSEEAAEYYEGYRQATFTNPVIEKPQRGIIDRVLGRKDEMPLIGFKVSGNNWLAFFSNNFWDKEGEVFPEVAIKDYVKRVDMKLVDMPYLTPWHLLEPTRNGLKGIAMGKAEMVAYHSNILFAGGHFFDDPDSQYAKKQLSKMEDQIRLSHGFLFREKDYRDGEYTQFTTFEISILPEGVEANPYTSFSTKEDKKMLTPEKVSWLEKIYGKEGAARKVKEIEEKSANIKAIGVGYKDMSPIGQLEEEIEGETLATGGKSVESGAFTELFPMVLDDLGALAENDAKHLSAVKAMSTQVKSLNDRIAKLEALLESANAAESVATGKKESNVSPDEAETVGENVGAKTNNVNGTTPEFDPLFPGMNVPLTRK